MDNQLFGFYRAKVVDNKDKQFYGRVKVWIPNIMPEIPDTEGLLAAPANNPIGGRNMDGDSENYYAGSSYIPPIGSWVLIFFENGDINKPFYFAALDLQNTRVLPENQVGDNPEDKWTILKSHSGRVIHISDDPSDERVEITGKKRQITSPPSGDTGSVYTIDGNMTTILFDERAGKEKVLIRTYKGDFFHIDIDQQNLQCYFKNNINIQSGNNLNLKADGEIHFKSDGDIFIESGGTINKKSANDINEQCGGTKNLQAGQDVNTDAININDQMGDADSSQGSSPEAPEGERDT